MENRIYKIRAHHGMCVCFFRGEGYSNEFTSHMGKIVGELSSDPMVQIISAADEICEKCPNNNCGICLTEDKVSRYDGEVLRSCGIAVGDVLPFSEFKSKVQENIIRPCKREDICSDCEWSEICR